MDSSETCSRHLTKPATKTHNLFEKTSTRGPQTGAFSSMTCHLSKGSFHGLNLVANKFTFSRFVSFPPNASLEQFQLTVACEGA